MVEEKVDEKEEEEEEEEMVAVVVVLVFMALRLRISDSQARVYIQRVLLTITGPVTWRPLNDYHGRLQQCMVPYFVQLLGANPIPNHSALMNVLKIATIFMN